MTLKFGNMKGKKMRGESAKPKEFMAKLQEISNREVLDALVSKIYILYKYKWTY